MTSNTGSALCAGTSMVVPPAAKLAVTPSLWFPTTATRMRRGFAEELPTRTVRTKVVPRARPTVMELIETAPLPIVGVLDVPTYPPTSLTLGGCQPTLPTRFSTLAAAPRTIPDVDADRDSIARLA